jgi:hypothetical protein
VLHEGGTIVVAWASPSGGAVEWMPSGGPAGVSALCGPTGESWARNPRHGLPPWRQWPGEWADDLADWERLAGMRLAAADVADPADPVRARWRADVEAAHWIVQRNGMLVVAIATKLVARGRLSGDQIARIAGRQRQRIDVARSAGLAVAI